MFLLRALFPSWRFFVSVGSEIKLEVRVGAESTQLSDWTPLLKPISRSALNFFYNPGGNYLHACHNAIEHVINDIAGLTDATGEAVERLVSYRVVQNLVRFEIAKRSCRVYQFRVTTRGPHDSAAQVAILSAVVEM